ncbi:MAG TPA: hypothetical protein VFH95_07775 [Candidatus Kapabacteria bacterium]|nr:hypothetical protein [Candidatus Kapabacteria bacterium]
MKHRFSIIFHTSYFILFLAVLAGCAKKEDMTPVQPGEMVTYTDLVFHFNFKAPKNWVAESVPGSKTTYYSTPSTETRFQNFTEGDMGARIEVGVFEHSTKEKAANDFKQSMSNVTFTGPTPDSLGGLPALRIDYSLSGDENGLVGYRIFTDKDSLVTYFDAATFGAQRMAKYAPIFDPSKASVQPAFVLKITNGKYDSASMAAMMQQMEPSSTFSTYNGSGFTIQYPDNFSASPMSGGVEIKGERADAMVRVDANTVQKGITLDKYVSDNAQKTYHGAAVQKTSVGAASAQMVSYGSAGATARAYFIMPNPTTIYRITVSWPNSLESAFRPALEKSVQSFKAK